MTSDTATTLLNLQLHTTQSKTEVSIHHVVSPITVCFFFFSQVITALVLDFLNRCFFRNWNWVLFSAQPSIPQCSGLKPQCSNSLWLCLVLEVLTRTWKVFLLSENFPQRVIILFVRYNIMKVLCSNIQMIMYFPEVSTKDNECKWWQTSSMFIVNLRTPAWHRLITLTNAETLYQRYASVHDLDVRFAKIYIPVLKKPQSTYWSIQKHQIPSTIYLQLGTEQQRDLSMNHSNHIKRIILAAVMRHMIRNNRNCDFTWEKI